MTPSLKTKNSDEFFSSLLFPSETAGSSKSIYNEYR